MKPADSSTVHMHKHQFVWQILVPFLVMTALVIAGTVLVITGGASRTRVWADVSVIWILAPMLILALMFIIVLGFIIYGFARLLPLIPRYTGRAQEITASVAAGTHKVADGVKKPFAWFQQAGAAISSFIKRI